MEWLPISIFPREARFAHVASAFRLTENYVPFVRPTECNLAREVASSGPIDEWHVVLEKTVTVEKLGSYPICPRSRKKRDLRAIRPIDRGIRRHLRCRDPCGLRP